MKSALKVLGGLSTSTVSDALDRLEIPGQCFGIMPVFPGGRMCGPAFTLKYLPVGHGGGTVGDFLDSVQPGDVVAIDNNGRTDCTVWGDIMTFVASKRGIAGTVINGICRDVDRSREMKYPIFSIAHWMRTGKDRVRLVAVNEPINMGNVSVDPGDILLGDDNGVVAIPSARAREVAELAFKIEEVEDRIRAAVAEGLNLGEARRKFGYHVLQTRQN